MAIDPPAIGPQTAHWTAHAIAGRQTDRIAAVGPLAYAANMARPRLRRLSMLLAASLSVGLTASHVACATGIEGLARKGVKGGIEGGLEGTLEALNDPHNKQLLRQILQDPDIKNAAHDLTEALTGGALDGLTEEDRMKRVRDLSDAYIRTVSSAVGKALNEDISPAMTRTVESVVGGAVASALRPENKALARSFVDGLTRSTISAFTQSTGQGLRDDLGPALNKVIAQDLGPALQVVLQDNLGPALNKVITQDLKPAIADAFSDVNGPMVGAMAREVTRQIVLGANDGMSELGISLSPNSKDGLGMLGWLAIVLGLVAVILGILLTRTILTRRALTQERIRSEKMLLNVLHTIQTGDDDNPTNMRDLDMIMARARQYDPELDTNDTYLASILAKARLPPRSAPAARRPVPTGPMPSSSPDVGSSRSGTNRPRV